MSEYKVRIENLSKTYSTGEGVKNINLNIIKGELLCLLGPSGCGKTTILRCLGGFNEVSDGKIFIDEEDVTITDPKDRPTSMVFQGYNLWPHMTVYENLTFGLKFRKIPKDICDEKVKDILDMIKMPGVEKKFPAQLSGGQQQRIAIARSLLLEPQVLLLDEPFSALDAKIRMQMREELKRIQSDLNITVVFVTHDQEEAMVLSDRIAVMNKGDIAQIDSPLNIYENPKNLFVASFIGEMNFLELGQKEILAFRPEEVIINKNKSGKYSGKIITKMIIGHYVQYIIKTDKNEEIKCFQNKAESKEFEVNDDITYDIINIRKYELKGEKHEIIFKKIN